MGKKASGNCKLVNTRDRVRSVIQPGLAIFIEHIPTYKHFLEGLPPHCILTEWRWGGYGIFANFSNFCVTWTKWLYIPVPDSFFFHIVCQRRVKRCFDHVDLWPIVRLRKCPYVNRYPSSSIHLAQKRIWDEHVEHALRRLIERQPTKSPESPSLRLRTVRSHLTLNPRIHNLTLN